MSKSSNPVRLLGKALVAVGLTTAILMAVAAPVAFSMELAAPLKLLELAGVGILIGLTVIRVGDLLADRVARPREQSGPDLPKGRDARTRSVRMPQPALQTFSQLHANRR